MAKRSNKRVPSGPKVPRRKTDSGESTQKDPVVQKAPPKEVVKAIREMPEKPKAVVPVPTPKEAENAEPITKAPGPFDHIDRKYFNDAWIEKHHKNPADILSIFESLKRQHTRLRALNSPGRELEVQVAREKMQELQKILQVLSYSV